MIIKCWWFLLLVKWREIEWQKTVPGATWNSSYQYPNLMPVNSFTCAISFTPTTTLWGRYSHCFHYSWGNRGTERRDLPKITQLVNGQAYLRTWVVSDSKARALFWASSAVLRAALVNSGIWGGRGTGGSCYSQPVASLSTPSGLSSSQSS